MHNKQDPMLELVKRYQADLTKALKERAELHQQLCREMEAKAHFEGMAAHFFELLTKTRAELRAVEARFECLATQTRVLARN